MTNWKKFMLFAAIIAVMGFVTYQTTFATTDTFNTPTSDKNVGGLPFCVTVDGASASSAEDITVTLPTGFDPEMVIFIDDYDATNADVYRWTRGMPDNSAIKIEGSTGVITYSTLAGGWIDADETTVTFNSDMQVNSGNYIGWICR